MRLFLFFLFLVCSIIVSFADEWNRFRGHNGNGYSETSLPLSLNSENFAWQVKLPGVGHASPVLWKNTVFTTCAASNDATQFVLAYEARSGKKLWQKKFPSSLSPIHKFNSYASATPAVDQDFIYVSWTTKKSNDLLCLDHKGNLVWRRNFGNYLTQHGNGFSPIAHQQLVFVTHDHEGASALYALNRENGKTVWQVNRNGAKPSASTPVIYNAPSGKSYVVSTSQSHGCYAVEITSGKIAWETGPDTLDKRSVSSPYWGGGFFFASCGSGGRGSRFLIIQPPRNDNEKVHIKHSITRNAPYVPTSLVVDDFVFALSDSGIASAIDLMSGEVLWKERLAGNFFASPILSRKTIFVPSRDGKIFALEVNRKKLKVLEVSTIGDIIHNTPALSEAGIFLRTFSQLIHIQAKT